MKGSCERLDETEAAHQPDEMLDPQTSDVRSIVWTRPLAQPRRWLWLVTVVALGAGCATPGPSVSASDAPPRKGDAAARRAALYDHGRWVVSNTYGEVWRPTRLTTSWRPYTNGYWSHRPSGWTWRSDYSWGWVAFHYGRWAEDPVYGWVWIPGDVWAPAWVSWRHTDAHVAWAPLPPWRGYGAWRGQVAPGSWCFVDQRSFRRRRFRPRVISVNRNPTLLGKPSVRRPPAVADGVALRKETRLWPMRIQRRSVRYPAYVQRRASKPVARPVARPEPNPVHPDPRERSARSGVTRGAANAQRGRTTAASGRTRKVRGHSDPSGRGRRYRKVTRRPRRVRSAGPSRRYVHPR